MHRAHLVVVALVLAACGGEPPAQPAPDAAAPCGGACGPGTTCGAGRCVPLDAPDAGPDVAADAAPDVAPADAEQPDAAAEAGLDASDADAADVAADVAYLDTAGLCDGGIVLLWYDDDGDGYGNTAAGPTGRFCDAMIPARYYATRAGDCDDRDPAVHAGRDEVCGNGRDDNCEGHVDEGCR